MNDSETINEQSKIIISLNKRLVDIEALIPPGYTVGNTLEEAVADVVRGLREMTTAARTNLVALEEAENVIEEVRADRDSWKNLVGDNNSKIEVLCVQQDEYERQIFELKKEIEQLKRDKENMANAMMDYDPTKYDRLQAEVAHFRSENESLRGSSDYWEKHYNELRLNEAALGIEANKWKRRFEIEQGKNAGCAGHEETLRRERDEADTKYKALCQTLAVLEKKLAHWNKVGAKIRGRVSEGGLDGPKETPRVRKFRHPLGFVDNTDYLEYDAIGGCTFVLRSGERKVATAFPLSYAIENWEEIV